ncbi:unnamed protein product [Lathyrus oleraceus]
MSSPEHMIEETVTLTEVTFTVCLDVWYGMEWNETFLIK